MTLHLSRAMMPRHRHAMTLHLSRATMHRRIAMTPRRHLVAVRIVMTMTLVAHLLLCTAMTATTLPRPTRAVAAEAAALRLPHMATLHLPHPLPWHRATGVAARPPPLQVRPSHTHLHHCSRASPLQPAHFVPPTYAHSQAMMRPHRPAMGALPLATAMIVTTLREAHPRRTAVEAALCILPLEHPKRGHPVAFLPESFVHCFAVVEFVAVT
jgi:hypothetical protein